MCRLDLRAGGRGGVGGGGGSDGRMDENPYISKPIEEKPTCTKGSFPTLLVMKLMDDEGTFCGVTCRLSYR